MNGFWGYVAKEAKCRDIVSLTAGLVGCVSSNGNLLLNMGPDSLGRIPAEVEDTLRQLAEWFRTNGEAVTGCGKSVYQAPFGTCYTQKGNVIYCYLLVPPLGDLILPGLRDKIAEITLLRTGEAVEQIPVWGYELLKKGDWRVRPKDVKAGDVLKIVLKS